MYIDKYKKDNGYYDKEGLYYEDAKSFIQGSILGFCGCGNLKGNLNYIQDGLNHIDIFHTFSRDLTKFNVQWEKWITNGIKIFGNKRARYFFFYWCDKEELTEHGSKIPGWLTKKGKELLEDLEKLDLK